MLNNAIIANPMNRTLALPAPSGMEYLNLITSSAGLSIHTQRSYLRWIKTYLIDVGYTLNYDSSALVMSELPTLLNSAFLRVWVGKLRQRGLGKQSITQAKSSIVWLAQLLADMDKVSHDVPARLSRIKTPRSEDGQRRGTWLSVEQTRTLIESTKLSSPNPSTSARNELIVSLLVLCGLRRDEATHIRWKDIELKAGNWTLTVHGKGSKLRQIKLGWTVVQIIDQWRDFAVNRDDLEGFVVVRIKTGGHITSAPMSDKAIWLVIKDVCNRIGLGNVAPHDLRRTFARGAWEAGASLELVRQALGHSSIAMTEHYINCALEMNRAASDIWCDAVMGK